MLRIGMRDDPDLLDPTFSRTCVGSVVMTAICDRLFDVDAKLNIHRPPLIHLWTTRNIHRVSRRVEGVTLLADGLPRLQDVRFR